MEINNLNLIPVTGKADNSFVGIKISNNEIEFHYPETYSLSVGGDALRHDIITILRTISLAKTKTSDMSSYNSQYDSSNVFPLGAYLWIISDYLTYGRYENREKVYQRGARGKIDWKKTMHSNPIISEGNVIYTDIISEKKSQKDNLLTEIYNFCVRKAVDSIGWLYGVVFDSEGIDYYRLFNERRYLNAINTELSHTFDDTKKIRLQHMKNIITGLDDDLINTREVIYGVDSYDYVYERMVDAMFSNIKNIREFYPNATWDLLTEKKKVNSSNLRPDTVLIKDDKVFILDAKNYRFGVTFKPGDMPETTSIQKQVTYGEYVKRVRQGEFKEVYSAFVIPYDMGNNPYVERFNAEMEFVGIAEPEWAETDGIKSRKIAAILVDTRFLINNWLHKNEDNLNRIIEIIETNVDRGVVHE